MRKGRWDLPARPPKWVVGEGCWHWVTELPLGVEWGYFSKEATHNRI